MGALAHYLEEEGLATTQISLIREHTEVIRPPRALWVPFELGRPLGVPNDPAFQTRVLRAALVLLEAQEGPVLEDFQEEAPFSGDTSVVLSCPVELAPEEVALREPERLCAAFTREFTRLRPWYDLSLERRGRTTVGVSGLEVGELVDFLCRFLDGTPPEGPREDIPLEFTFKLAVDDLKAYYFEAVTAQPGQALPSSDRFAGWFWDRTAAGKLLVALKQACAASDNPTLQLVGKKYLVPRALAHHGG